MQSLTKRFVVCLSVLGLYMAGSDAAEPDTPFLQPISHQILLPKELGEPRELAIDHDGIVYVLTTKGVARLFGNTLAMDRTYRPLAGKVARDITIVDGRAYYLFPEEVLSNRRAGKFVRKTGKAFERFAVNTREEVLLQDSIGVHLFDADRFVSLDLPREIHTLIHGGDDFFALTPKEIFIIREGKVRKLAEKSGITTAAVSNGQLAVGATKGFFTLDPITGSERLPLQQKLPSTHITALEIRDGEIWAGTKRGVWMRTADGAFRYFASRRWLNEDTVIDLKLSPAGDLFVLTPTGLNRIEFRKMTLAQKAMHYEEKIRTRHVRYGFCAELRLNRPGDITSAEMIDTDNDGTWSNYYMASQAFRFGATGDPQAKRNAWETFEALERLEAINPLGGFPSRTFERVGFKVSDPDRWHPVGDGIWDWKAHTSSDEVTAHAFGSAVLYECAATTKEEKERIATFIGKIIDHIIRNNWYLIDVDGQPTLWARWNPEYVNGFPLSVFDRRLNSAEIIALLQLGYKITGRELYREKAFELLEKHGYLENISSAMERIAFTKGYLHKGIELGTEWNHSDDLLAFVAYWVLHRFAFNDDLRAKYAEAIRNHWEMEKVERCPIWNFVYASTGAKDFDLKGALWTLRYFPWDMTDWAVSNSHRQDITRLPENFRQQQLKELLPPDERRITRWNSQPFILDGGDGGHTELAGDEFLLPYWMGRYLKIIE